MLLLISAYDALVNGDNAVKCRDNTLGNLALTGNSFTSMENKIEELVSVLINNAYGSFIAFTDPILSFEEINKISGIVYTHMPDACRIIEIMLGYTGSLTRTKHLKQFRKRMIMYEIIAFARVWDNHNFTLFSCIRADLFYGQLGVTSMMLPLVFFSHACSMSTFMRNMTDLRNKEIFFNKVSVHIQGSLNSIDFNKYGKDNNFTFN